MLFLQFLESCAQRGFGHNFVPRHARGSIKGSVDADDRLVSKKILSHKNGLLD